MAAISDVSCSIRTGCTIGVLGANGSGKSTLALLFAGLLQPSSGTLVFSGPSENDESRLAGLLLQNPDNNLVGATVAEDVAFGPVNMGLAPAEVAARVADVMAEVGVSSLSTRDPATLSEGEKQLVALAGLLAMRPRFLILDEPTSALDREGRARVMGAVRKLASLHGMGVMLISQTFEEVLGVDLLIILRDGRVEFSGAPSRALALGDSVESLGVEPPALSFIWRAVRTPVQAPSRAIAYGHEGAVDELCRLLS